MQSSEEAADCYNFSCFLLSFDLIYGHKHKTSLWMQDARLHQHHCKTCRLWGIWCTSSCCVGTVMFYHVMSCIVMCRLWGTWCTRSCSEETSPARTRRISCARCCTVLYCTVLYCTYTLLYCTGAGLGGRLGGGGQVLCRHRHHLHRRHCLPRHLLHSQVQINTTLVSISPLSV